jgi:benzoylformate decarboxylase
MSITSLDELEVRSRRGADVLIEVLRSEGVHYIFGNPGTTELPLMDALVDAPDISYILALQEASAVAMADGYAQAAGRPGFLNLHTAGGLGHGFGNLLNAGVSGTPLVVTAGQQDSRHTLTDPLLYGDLVSIAAPAVKWAREVAHANQIPILVRRALHDSQTAPTGAVFLSFPMDVMEEVTTIGIGEVSTIDRSAIAGSLDRLAEYLAAVEPGKLAIIAGDEVSSSNAAREAVLLADALGAPVYGSSWPAHIPFPTAHPLWMGNLPTQATEIAKELEAYDAIFALGGKSLITIVYTEGSAVPPGIQIFQLSADARDLGRTYPTKLSVVGDIRASLASLLPILVQRTAGNAAAYVALREAAKREHDARHTRLIAAADAEFDAPVTTPLVASREMARAIGPDVAIVGILARLRSDSRGFRRRRRRGALFSSSPVDRSTRKTAGHLCRSQQRRIQHLEEIHEVQTALRLCSGQSLHRSRYHESRYRLSGAGSLDGRLRSACRSSRRHCSRDRSQHRLRHSEFDRDSD